VIRAEIGCEQAVYGSFPFWQRGYGILARSANCRDDWLGALQRAGQRFGERPTGIAEKPCLLALRLQRAVWMVVGVFPQGCDDQARPGALAFHGLFVTRWNYWWAGHNPFAFAPALRGEWQEADQDAILPARTLTLPGRQVARENGELVDDRVETIVTALRQRRKVVVPSAEPIDELARAVWTKLPGSVRRRASVATWAFCNNNHFDLVAVPRVMGISTDPSEIVMNV
jgi:hypothetical protein